ncbi:MAG: NAD(P)H-dependent oxidoreductase subunit E [Thermoplasmatota archaeon]
METRREYDDENTIRIIEEHGTDVKNLIPILQDVQEIYGYLPSAAISRIAEKLQISEDVIFGVATFYTHFKFTKPGEHTIKACLGTACFVKGSENLLEILKDRFGIEPGETSKDNSVSLERVACLGCCALAPTIVVDDEVHGNMSSVKLTKIIDELKSSRPSEGGDN